MRRWIVNEGPKWFISILWLFANIGLFVGYYLKYHNGSEYFYLRILIGDSLSWARASAACLNFNCMLILLPVCRNLISFLRGSCTCCKRNCRRQLDKNVTFHRCLAYMICLHTAIHIAAHCFNFERMIEAYDSPNEDLKEALAALSSLPTTPNGSYINPIRTQGTSSSREVFQTVAGITGVVITLALILMVSSSTEFIRRSFFEVFWFTHHLFIIFFIGLVVHGMQGIIHSQTNEIVHNPQVCFEKFDQWGTDPECPEPEFAGSPAQTWIWVIGPMVIYVLERAVRFVRSCQAVSVVQVVQHPSNVFEVRMKKSGFKMQTGQYIFLHCPSISQLEWHPFTLTSCPTDDYFSVHIRKAGDWTNALAKTCHVDGENIYEVEKMPRLAVDGPFGTATEDIFRYQVDVFVAAGIGITPFASVLKHIWHTYRDQQREMKLRKVYLYWICSDTQSFEWMQELLRSLEMQLQEFGNSNFLSYNIYLTRGWDKQLTKKIVLNEGEERDVITGLTHKTQFGRPKWNTVFQDIAAQYPGVSVGVFCCGPKSLSAELHKLCNQHSSSDPQGVRFFYNKEHF